MANFMKCSDDAAFHDRPKAFNRICVNRTDNILALAMVNNTVWKFFIQRFVGAPCISAEQADAGRYAFTNEADQGLAVDPVNHSGDYVPLALHGSNDYGLAGTDPAARAAASAVPVFALVLVFVLRFATNKGFINLDNPDQLLKLDVAMPARPLDCGGDELGADVSFAEFFFIQSAFFPTDVGRPS